jgi:Ser/Thr protein kinase RdoA (MazF antagonist)
MTTRWPESDELQRFLAGEGWQTAHVARRMGAANRHGVFLLENGGRRAVLKLHEPSAAGRRDAFAHEARLHSFYAEHAGDHVPRLLAQDPICRGLLFEYVPGAPVDGGEASSADVARMADFLLATNRPAVLERARQSDLPAASDCGLSAADHWQCALSRLDALLGLKAADEATVTMKDFVRSELRPALAASKPDAGPAVLPCLSPSDFGFHNVVRREGGSLCFIDFEHAGWDDPAKLVADFILQPEAPLGSSQTRMLVTKLQGAPPFGPDLGRRAMALLPVQKVKWAAIILNVFERPEATAESRLARLTKAMEYWRSDRDRV